MIRRPVPQEAWQYNSIGVELVNTNQCRVLLADSRILTAKECFLAAIHHDQNEKYAGAWTNLASTLACGEEVELLDGRCMDYSALVNTAMTIYERNLAEARAHPGSMPETFVAANTQNLATLCNVVSVRLYKEVGVHAVLTAADRKLTLTDLLVKAIHLDPLDNPYYYENLAVFNEDKSGKHTISFLDGRRVSLGELRAALEEPNNILVMQKLNALGCLPHALNAKATKQAKRAFFMNRKGCMCSIM